MFARNNKKIMLCKHEKNGLGLIFDIFKMTCVCHVPVRICGAVVISLSVNYSCNVILITYFLVFILNRLISGGLEPVLIHSISSLASYYIKFSTNINDYFVKNAM